MVHSSSKNSLAVCRSFLPSWYSFMSLKASIRSCLFPMGCVFSSMMSSNRKSFRRCNFFGLSTFVSRCKTSFFSCRVVILFVFCYKSSL